jgi:hydroxycarboxylate dehydrogenase B
VDVSSARAMDSIAFSPAALTRVARAIVEQGGSEPGEALLVAENLVLSNASGHASHGVGMLPRYVGSLLEGGLLPNQHVRVDLDSGSLLRLDAGAGYGQVAGREAMALGIERAERLGVCVVALGNAHHLGRIGHWAEQCLEAGLVSLHFVNVVSRPIVAPFGGLDARTGTNPVCIGIPRPVDPIVLDFATSRIAQGKTRVAFNRGEHLPLGYVIDDRGAPTTDPRYAVVPPFGALLPFGEHKGFGLSVAVELLAGALGAGFTCRERYAGKARILNGMLSILIDPAQLGDREAFMAEAEAYLEWLRQSPVAEGDRILLPGEPERLARQQSQLHGISLDTATWNEIATAGERLGLPRAECEDLARRER